MNSNEFSVEFIWMKWWIHMNLRDDFTWIDWWIHMNWLMNSIKLAEVFIVHMNRLMHSNELTDEFKWIQMNWLIQGL